MDSPFKQYLSTNYTPSHEEEGHIRELVSDYRQEIRYIDSEIEVLQQQINTLFEIRDEIEEFADKHQELISPVRMLTRDILECIFLACIPEGKCPMISVYNAPMLLTRVCSSWRRIALSTPQLWTTFHITLPAMHVEDFAVSGSLEKQEARTHRILTLRQLIVNHWLEQSGACPLTVSIRQEVACYRADVDVEGFTLAMERIQKAQLLMIKNTILSCHQRWHGLDLWVSDDLARVLVEAGTENELCRQTLKHIHITHRVDFPPNRLTFHLKDILPSETVTATLYDITISDSIPKNQFWRRLTHLNLSFPCFSDINRFDFILELLGHFPQLITLKLNVGGDENNTMGNPDATTVLPHLTNLSMSLPPTHIALSFVHQMCLPALNELDIEIRSYYDGDDWTFPLNPEVIIKSLVRVAEDFHTLRLFQPDWIKSSNDLLLAMKAVPSVKHLKIVSNSVEHCRWVWRLHPYSSGTRVHPALDDSLLHMLTPMQKDHSHIICPLLEDFECDEKWLAVFSESVLKAFLISRRNDPRVVPIRRLVVTINNYKRTDDSDSSEKISLGDDSAIYFRRQDTEYQWYDYDDLFSDMYKEL